MTKRWFWWLPTLFASFLVVGAFIPAARGRQDRVAVLTVVIAVCAFSRYRLGIGDRPEPPESYVSSDLGIADEQDVRLARLDASIRRAAESGEHFARAFVPLLRALVTERLADRAGVDVNADPAGARRLMGEELWQIFATPVDERGPAPGPERLRSLVGSLERL